MVRLLFMLLVPIAAMSADDVSPIPVQIEADQLEVEHGDGQARFSGHVKLVRGTFVLHADQLTAHYGDKGGKMHFSYGRAEGNVRFEEGDRQGSADAVLFDQVSGVVTLMGNAELEQPGGRISGDSIEYNLDSGDTNVRQGESGRVKLRIEQEPASSAGVLPTP